MLQKTIHERYTKLPCKEPTPIFTMMLWQMCCHYCPNNMLPPTTQAFPLGKGSTIFINSLPMLGSLEQIDPFKCQSVFLCHS